MELEPDDLREFLQGYLDGDVEEYQMAAFLMAVQFQGMTPGELSVFVGLMLHSGAVLTLGDLGPSRVDKHSTGGVGDKVSLVLASLVACTGLLVPMMSGRGLGHTGGTLDKLESIPGFRTDLSLDRFRKILGSVGTAMIGQSDDIAPLDRRLYALRSVTGTVPSIPLISSSIMSKKLAEDLTRLVLDVKVGSGAFLSAPDRAVELARTMVSIGADHGVETVALLTAMDRPLGRSVGNALEVREAIACLRGGGPDDVRSVVLALADEMTGVPGRAERLLDSGDALERFREMVELQGGDPGVVDAPERLPSARVVRDVCVPRAGRIRRIEPRALGEAVVDLGGGRTRLGGEIHPGVGVDHLVSCDSEVTEGDRIARVHARSETEARKGVHAVLDAVEWVPDSDRGRHEGLLPLIGERIRLPRG